MDANDQRLKKGFFKKVWYSIFKLEKYGEMSAEGSRRAIKYLMKISLILAIVLSLGTIYQINEKVKKGVIFLEEQVGNFTYKEGILQLENPEPIVAPSSTLGKVIIDTNVETEEEINQYLNSIEENIGIILLKDKILVKGLINGEVISYEYSSLLSELNIDEIDKQGVIDYVSGNNMWNLYVQIFIIICIYSFFSTFLSVILNAFLLSIFGLIAAWIARIKIRYAAIFNLAAYSLTLSILLQTIYIGVNVLTGFTVKYFQVMYIAVSTIYLIASIFLIKSEFLKRQSQEVNDVDLIKEKEEEDLDDSEEQNGKQEEQKDNGPKDDKPKDDESKGEEKNEKEENEDNNSGKNPEGSEA